MGYNEIGGNKLKIQGGIKMKTLFTKRDYFVTLTLSALLAMTMLCWACGGDGTETDADACCDADVQPDGNDDVDSDADTIGDDTPVQYGSLAVTSTPVQGAAIELDGDPSGQRTDYTFPNVEARTHSVLLSLTGRLAVPDGCTALPCPPASVDVTTAGTDVNTFLGWNLAGNWENQADHMVDPWTMQIWGPDAQCPEGGLQVWGIDSVGRLCLEPDDTLTLCKTHAAECDAWVDNGQILNSGQRVQFTVHAVATGLEQTLTYVKRP
jgi:hypothetical protein